MSALQQGTVKIFRNQVKVNNESYWIAQKGPNKQRTTAMSEAAVKALGVGAKLGFGAVADHFAHAYDGDFIEIYAMVDSSPMHGPRRCFVLYDREIKGHDNSGDYFASNAVGYISISKHMCYSNEPDGNGARPNVVCLKSLGNGKQMTFRKELT